MSSHPLDRWMRCNHLRMRIALGVFAAVEAAAWLFDLRPLMLIVAPPAAVLATLVMLYLPRTPLQSRPSQER